MWILLKQETVSGSGISWAVCKSAPRSRQIATPVPHHSEGNTQKHTENKQNEQICLTHTHTHPFNSHFSRTTRVSRYQKGKTNVDFTEAKVSEWQWHQLGHMQVCTSLQTDNHTSTPSLSFLQAGCSSCRPTNSVKALKETHKSTQKTNKTSKFA